MRNISLKLTLFVLFIALSGCASVDFDMPKTDTYAPTDTDDTFLGRQLEGVAEQYPTGQQPLDGRYIPSCQSLY